MNTNFNTNVNVKVNSNFMLDEHGNIVNTAYVIRMANEKTKNGFRVTAYLTDGMVTMTQGTEEECSAYIKRVMGIPDEETKVEKTKVVNIRGHYRHYKSGKTTWVKPHMYCRTSCKAV